MQIIYNYIIQFLHKKVILTIHLAKLLKKLKKENRTLYFQKECTI